MDLKLVSRVVCSFFIIPNLTLGLLSSPLTFFNTRSNTARFPTKKNTSHINSKLWVSTSPFIESSHQETISKDGDDTEKSSSVSSWKRNLKSSVNRDALDQIKFPRTWVPLGSTFELDPDRPTPLEFLGQKYVTYRNHRPSSSGDINDWVVLDDICPHRLVPLSEGRIDSERQALQCSYHGWEFDASGSCKNIPQLSDEKKHKTLSSKKACVASYPTIIEKNILWIWPWKEDPLSVIGDPMAHPEMMLSGAVDNPSTYTRDLPYGWDCLTENLIDPSHIPFAHHGLQGTRDDAIAINMTQPIDKGERGFEFKFEDRTMGLMRGGDGSFLAPFVISYNAEYQSDIPRSPFQLTSICIPTKPGWSRTIILTGSGNSKKSDHKDDGTADNKALKEEQNDDTKKKKKSLISIIFSLVPVWLIHQLSNRFLDSDLAFLHYQGQERRRHKPNYFLPAPADRCIDMLRRWIPKYVDVDHVLYPLPSELPRSVMFDRYAQHTSHCKHCQKALTGMKKWRPRIYFLLTLSIMSLNKFMISRLMVLLSLATLRVITILENSMKVGEFKHYLNH